MFSRLLSNTVARRKFIASLSLGMLSLAAPKAFAQRFKPDYSGKDLGRAPEFMVSEWLIGPPVTIGNSVGKVVLIDFFQLWCPGCKSFTIPTFQRWEKRYEREIADGKIALVSIHTVFEGHDYQTPDRLREFVQKTGFNHAVANDQQHENFHIPATMLAYGTRGTPEVAVVDKFGRKRFTHIGRFDVAKVEGLVDRLLQE